MQFYISTIQCTQSPISEIKHRDRWNYHMNDPHITRSFYALVGAGIAGSHTLMQITYMNCTCSLSFMYFLSGVHQALWNFHLFKAICMQRPVLLSILERSCSVISANKFLCWRMLSSGMWRRVNLVRTDSSEKRVASIFRVSACWSTANAFLNRGFSNPVHGGDMFLRNVCSHKTHPTPHPRKRQSS
jgi:hypothetical protein